MKKTVTKNYIFNTAYQILIMVLPLIVTPYVSRILGAENIGIYGYVISISAIFILFGNIGMNLYGQREIAYVQSNKKKISNVFTELMIIKIITMTVSIICFILAFVITDNSYNLYYKILILELIGNMIDVTWLYQGLEEFGKIFKRNFIIKLFSTISIFLFVKDKTDLNVYLLIYALSVLLGNVSLYISLFKNIELVSIKNINLKRHSKKILQLFFPQIAIQLSTVVDKTMLGVFSTNGMFELGIYEQSYKIIIISVYLITSLGTVMIPRIANLFAQKKKDEIKFRLKKSFHFVWLFGIPLSLGLIGISRSIVPWFLSQEFIKAINVISVGSLFIIVSGLSNITGMQYLIPIGRQNQFTISIIIGLLVNIIGNYFLIPIMGAIGAIMFTVISELIIFTVQLIFLKNEISLHDVFYKAFKPIISGIIMLGFVFWLSSKLKPILLNSLIIVIIGFLIYTVLLIILKDSLMKEIIQRIKGILKKLKFK